MSGPPELEHLVGEDLPTEERERLRRVHDLLVAAGPPPELPPSLAKAPPLPTAQPGFLPRRRRAAVLLLAAALTAAAFGGGYLAGSGGSSFRTSFVVPMHGTDAAHGALASIRVGKRDPAGNWPMLVTVRGLKSLPRGGYYQLFLTRNHRPAASCGIFTVRGAVTAVRFSVPYELRNYDGWVLAVHLPGGAETSRILMTT